VYKNPLKVKIPAKAKIKSTGKEDLNKSAHRRV
jgi:hypothetical protein